MGFMQWHNGPLNTLTHRRASLYVLDKAKGPFGFEGYINTGIDILNFNSRVFEYQYLDTRRP
jgi:hypothetical protein